MNVGGGGGLMATSFAVWVALVMPGSTLRESLRAMLPPFGFEVVCVESAAELGVVLVARDIQHVVLQAGLEPETVLATVARLRERSRVGIIVLTDADQVDARVSALLIGADACLSLPVDARELAAVMLGVSRRLGGLSGVRGHPGALADEPGSVAPQQWWLASDNWILIAPDGMQIELTQGERGLLSCFVSQGGAVVSRGELAQALRGHSPGGGDGAENTQRISMVVSRLRKKVARAGLRLPLRVVRGAGYEFHDQLAQRPLPGGG